MGNIRHKTVDQLQNPRGGRGRQLAVIVPTRRRAPPAPAECGDYGRAVWTRFWRTVQGDLELEAHEAAILEEVCRTLDRLEALAAEVRRGGMFAHDGRIATAVVESRLQSVALARLIASLRFPDEYRAEILDRGQRRGAARGTYNLKVVKRA